MNVKKFQNSLFHLLAAMLVCGSLNIASCDDDSSYPGEGDMGRGTFVYRCVDESRDAACHREGNPPAFPPRVAIGGEFFLSFESDYGYHCSVMPGTSETAERSNPQSGWVMKVAGFSSFLAVDDFDRACDVIHLYANQVTDIRIEDLDRGKSHWSYVENSIDLDGKLTLSLRALPIDDMDITLAGALDYSWQVRDETVVRIVGSSESGIVHLEAVEPGITELVVETSGVSKSFEIVSSGSAVEPDAGVDGGGGEEDGTDSETDTIADTASTTETETGSETEADTGTDEQLDAGLDGDAGLDDNDSGVSDGGF